MAEREIIHYLKNENNSDLIYQVAVTCIERLVRMKKPGILKAVLDAGTNGFYEMIKNEKK